MQQRSQTRMQQPNLSVSKANQDKASRLITNYLKAAEKSVKSNSSYFSTFTGIKNFISRNKSDPSEKLVLEVVKRMERDKLHSQVALQMTDITMNRVQNMQKTMIFKVIPYLLGFLATGILLTLIFFLEPRTFENPLLLRYIFGLGFALILLAYGAFARNKVKTQMIASNILFQASSAFATAKIQGKGSLGAMQSLGEMKKRAKAEEKKSKKKK